MMTGLLYPVSIFLFIFGTLLFFPIAGATVDSRLETQSLVSRISLFVAFFGTLAVLLYYVNAFDSWLGILAYRSYYLGCCLVIAIIGGLLVRRRFNSTWMTLAIGLVAFAILASPYTTTAPSSRILRGILLEVEPGVTTGEEVKQLIVNAYQASDYEMPLIEMSDDEIFVSLMTQTPGDVTSATFHLEDGFVVRNHFSPD